MNSKLEKRIRKQAQKLMLDWLGTVVPDEEKSKINVNNLQDYIPNQTHVYANGQLHISAYTPRWFVKRIKTIMSSSNKKYNEVSLQEIENGR
tara:strand:- start:253 stop:528 length:276 start_codon:yes stop_codon:yes gene_type:complete